MQGKFQLSASSALNSSTVVAGQRMLKSSNGTYLRNKFWDGMKVDTAPYQDACQQWFVLDYNGKVSRAVTDRNHYLEI